MGDGTGDVDAREAAAATKCLVSDTGDGTGDVDAREVVATPKCPHPDTDHGLRDDDAREIVATKERRLPDSDDAVSIYLCGNFKASNAAFDENEHDFVVASADDFERQTKFIDCFFYHFFCVYYYVRAVKGPRFFLLCKKGGASRYIVCEIILLLYEIYRCYSVLFYVRYDFLREVLERISCCHVKKMLCSC